MASRLRSVREALESYCRETAIEGISVEQAERVGFLSGIVAGIGMLKEGMRDPAGQAMAILREMMQ